MTGIDVFIPLHRKDLAVAPWSIASLRRYLSPTPSRIVVVSEFDEVLSSRSLRQAGAELLPVADLVEILPRSDMPSILVKGQQRSGWYYQQFIKWAVRRFASSDDYLIWDGDTVAIAPISVLPDGKPVFDRGNQYHLPYFRTYDALLGGQPQPLDSFITNYLTFRRSWLDELIADIHDRHLGSNWDRTILNAIDRTEMSSFSEYETYGYWLAARHPGAFSRGDGRNRELRRRHRMFHWINRWRALRAGCTTLSYFNHRR